MSILRRAFDPRPPGQDVARLRITRDQLRARIELARRDLEALRVTATTAGTVVYEHAPLTWSSGDQPRKFQLGDHVSPGTVVMSIGIDRIRARLFALTARWLRPAQRLAGFRSAVRLDPAHCAALVAWEVEGRRHEDVRAVLTKHKLLVGGTESYAGFFDIPADRPRSLFIANSALFTSPSDVDRLSAAMEAIARG